MLASDSLRAPGLMADPDLSARILFQATNAAIWAVYVGGYGIIDGGAHASLDGAALIDAMRPVSEKDRARYCKLQDAIRPFLLA
ncbi:hypothetical protein [Roseinatronobacter sp. S2]|uniref:hypothetical protein n=1 Tax=Roseinatronobacter sp. S2 TaxID=3035471 RepID=UPI0024104942|nr:hypothetical protein [Roseinatronobacter sp. S2]WFE76615.1 hypothetical protein P8S53_19040 [Roseinatronobacter sp. S2]